MANGGNRSVDEWQAEIKNNGGQWWSTHVINRGARFSAVHALQAVVGQSWLGKSVLVNCQTCQSLTLTPRITRHQDNDSNYHSLINNHLLIITH